MQAVTAPPSGPAFTLLEIYPEEIIRNRRKSLKSKAMTADSSQWNGADSLKVQPRGRSEVNQRRLCAHPGEAKPSQDATSQSPVSSSPRTRHISRKRRNHQLYLSAPRWGGGQKPSSLPVSTVCFLMEYHRAIKNHTIKTR